MLADITKGDPQDTDTHMSDTGDGNSFARANQGDSPDWTTRPMHIIQAAPHAEDSVTHDISNNSPEEGEYLAQPDEAVSSPPPMFPATTADGAVFYMQDTSQTDIPANSAGPAKSDVSMAVQSQDDAPPDLVEVPGRSSVRHESATASTYHVGVPPGLLDFSPAEDTLSPEVNAALTDMQALIQSESFQGISGDTRDDSKGNDLAPPLSDDDGYRSDIEEFQDISDDDVPKRDFFGADISSGYNDRAT